LEETKEVALMSARPFWESIETQARLGANAGTDQFYSAGVARGAMDSFFTREKVL